MCIDQDAYTFIFNRIACRNITFNHQNTVYHVKPQFRVLGVHMIYWAYQLLMLS